VNFFRGFSADIFISYVRDIVVDRGLNKLWSGRSGFRIPTKKAFVSSPKYLDRLWVPNSVLFSENLIILRV